jgi:CelD/BcsL family acetyltransferase involved in cellulose biosynthesis
MVRAERPEQPAMLESPQEPQIEVISSASALAELAAPWDELVSEMRRPSPFLLNSWLVEWWRHYGESRSLSVVVARRGGRLVAALPLYIRRQLGLRVAEFVGGTECAPLADLLLAPGESDETAAAVGGRAADAGDFVNLFGLSGDSRLVSAFPAETFHLVERLEAPVLDLSSGWEAVYETRLSSKARANRRRRRRQLEALGTVEVELARTRDELERDLEDAFSVYQLRWRGRRATSGFATPKGRAFYRAALRQLADRDMARLLTLRLDGRGIAFCLYLQLGRTLYGVTMAFDPALGRFGPGSEILLSTLESAAGEGIERAEFLGAAAEHKQRLTSRVDPVYQVLGLAGTARGRAAANAMVAGIELRRRAKRSKTARGLYYRLPRIRSLPKLSSDRRHER